MAAAAKTATRYQSDGTTAARLVTTAAAVKASAAVIHVLPLDSPSRRDAVSDRAESINAARPPTRGSERRDSPSGAPSSGVSSPLAA